MAKLTEWTTQTEERDVVVNTLVTQQHDQLNQFKAYVKKKEKPNS